jgi:hypothetical protein
MAAGCIAPNVWQNREKIEKAMVKHGPKMAKGTAKVAAGTAYVGARSVWAYGGGILALGLFGLPLLSRRYRNFFGMHFRPLFSR